MMALRRVFGGFCSLIVLLVTPMVLPPSVIAQDVNQGGNQTVEVHLTESFYRALRAEDSKSYSTGVSDEYLRQIAVSTRFMVETNLRIIEQQARIIQLLETGPSGPAR